MFVTKMNREKQNLCSFCQRMIAGKCVFAMILDLSVLFQCTNNQRDNSIKGITQKPQSYIKIRNKNVNNFCKNVAEM